MTGKHKKVVVVHDERMRQHNPNPDVPFLPGRIDRRVREILSHIGVKWHYPEHPGRLDAIMALLAREPVPGVRIEAGMPASWEQLARVHTTSFLKTIDTMRGQNAWLDVDTTAVSPGSVEAAEVAAGCAIAAVEAVAKGDADSAFAIVRPPGHHAESVRARGFCLFNNVAVAVAHAQEALGFERVLIVDWDAHHGNGTQEIFWADPNTMLFDIHRMAPFYPDSGALTDVGGGLGEGYTFNVPLPGGSGDSAMLKAFREILVPAAEKFQPDFILVSAGFDPHRLDQALNVSYEGFSAMTGILQELADRLCNGRLVFVLEGGYNVESLSRGVRAVLEVLAGAPPLVPVEWGLQEVEEAAAFHRGAFED